MQSLSQFLSLHSKDYDSISQTELFQILMKKHSKSDKNKLSIKNDKNDVLKSAADIFKGLEIIKKCSESLPQRLCFQKLKFFSSKSKKMKSFDKIVDILNKKSKTFAFERWKEALKLWKKKLACIKKLLKWNKMKTTSKVLHKWYSQHKYEESMMKSVYNKDYVISMYEILGNSQNSKQFKNKYYSIF